MSTPNATLPATDEQIAEIEAFLNRTGMRRQEGLSETKARPLLARIRADAAEIASLCAEPTTGDMAAFAASDQACHDYPDDTDIAKAQRAAFGAGAAWAAETIERLRAALERLILDYEDATGEPAVAARIAARSPPHPNP